MILAMMKRAAASARLEIMECLAAMILGLVLAVLDG